MFSPRATPSLFHCYRAGVRAVPCVLWLWGPPWVSGPGDDLLLCPAEGPSTRVCACARRGDAHLCGRPLAKCVCPWAREREAALATAGPTCQVAKKCHPFVSPWKARDAVLVSRSSSPSSSQLGPAISWPGSPLDGTPISLRVRAAADPGVLRSAPHPEASMSIAVYYLSRFQRGLPL